MKIFLIICLMFFKLIAVELPSDEKVEITEEKKVENIFGNRKIEIFGQNLFNGEFSKSSQHRFNPEYILNIGDSINLKLWGAIDLEVKLTVDEQGNIFVPKVGTIRLLGVKNKNLTKEIQKKLKKTYKNNVYSYANLDNFQPVTVFVTGGVIKPGLYEGLSSDSILQFIDKSQGILDNGSYRNISVIRDNKIISNVDLYDYLLRGQLDLLQFKTGDIVKVDYLKDYITVDGDVLKTMQLELKRYTPLKEVIKLVQPISSSKSVLISNYNEKNEKVIEMFSIYDKRIKIKSKDHIKFISNSNENDIEIAITGEHNGLKNIVVKKGTTLKEVLEKINYSTLSSKEDVNLYRKSVAVLQKQLLETSLQELESSVLKTGSTTKDEALIRKEEASLVLDFIKRAKEVEPQGRVVLNENSDFSKIVLEDQDTINIPKTSHVITVQGEVKIPSSISYVANMSFENYLQQCGGLNERADDENILIIHQNGQVITYDNSSFSNQDIEIKPGDSILVLGKPDTKNVQLFKDLTQILYQIAVGAGVLVSL